jgi:anaphase-promoting complex subunit 2
MAVVNAKQRVFESVFSSQSSILTNNSGRVSDQVHLDRSWQTVTQKLTLPTILNDSDILKPSNLKPDRAFDEALNDLHPQDIVLWYTNHVRRHYLNQIFPIIQSLRTTQDPKTRVIQCVRILEGAHRLYFEGLGMLTRTMEDVRIMRKNFRLNLSTIVSNSIPDRTAIKEVIRRHVSAVLSPHCPVPENDLLGLVRSLANVGLGGEK